MSTIKRNLGINADCLRGLVSTADTLPLIKEAGFVSFFTNEYLPDEVAAIKERADALQLNFEFIHAPFRGINAMWLSGLEYLTIFNQIKRSIDTAADNGVPAVITHVSSGWNAPAVNDLGLSRYDELVLYAKERGVILAFENLRMVGNLAILIDRYAHFDNVRFCFDSGHEHCYTKTVDWVDIFADKLYCTHVHDNHSRSFEDKASDGDEHLLPFDGTYDYAKMIHKLDKNGYTGSLMLEVFRAMPKYQALTAEAFLQTAYERIEKISKL